MQRESLPRLVEPSDARKSERMRSARQSAIEDATSAPTTRSPPDALLELVGELLIELRPGSPPRRVSLDDSIEHDLGLTSGSNGSPTPGYSRTPRRWLPVWSRPASCKATGSP
jgi:hypothetical protein